MTETAHPALDPDAHLLLDQPLLRLPEHLVRRNFKAAQRHIEITHKSLTTTLAAKSDTPAAALAALDVALAKAQGLKRKLEALRTEECALLTQQRARIEHLAELYDPSVGGLGDVKYERWAHTRLDRLLVDYMLRRGYLASARALAREKGVERLVDRGVFEECGRIEAGLRAGELGGGLAWCAEHKVALRKGGSGLEGELRLQQFVEMVREGGMGRLMEAVGFARRFLVGEREGGGGGELGLRAAGLLAQPADTGVEPYKTMYSPARYAHLAALFLKTHHDLFALPAQPLLHTALAAGLSALKTPSCHSVHNPMHQTPSTSTNPATTNPTPNPNPNPNANTTTPAPTNAPPTPPPTSLLTTPTCPICSTELNALARHVPYAHHTKSSIDDDPVVLPNGHIYGRERLRALNEKLGVEEGRVRDPSEGVGGREWSWGGEGGVRKVYIL
ncbi:hypothetical protein LTR08_002115 [Meristemomyces frigidus]|nr:hypothetical protein LTR08_002115 [Meristemomyces frigidus]